MTDLRPRPAGPAPSRLVQSHPAIAPRAHPAGPIFRFGAMHFQFVNLVILLLALQFILPARLVLPGMGAIGRPSIVAGALLLLLWALCVFCRPGLPSGWQPARLILAAYLVVQFIGYAVGFDRRLPEVEANSADRWIILNLAMAGLALATMDGIHSRRALDRLLKALVALAAVMAAIGVLQFFGIVDLTRYIRLPGLVRNAPLLQVGARGDGGLARVAGTANHYIEFGVVLALVLPLALHYAFFAPRGWRRVTAWVMVALVGGGVPLAISRSATLTVVVAVGILAVVWPWRLRYNVAVIGGISLVLFRLVNPGVLGTIRGLFTNANDDPSVQNRLSRVPYVLDLWSLRPWWGRGAGTIVPDQYILLDNQFYVTLLGGGIVGVAALVLLFAGPYLMARSVRLRGSDEESRHLAQALAATMPAALLASATFDSFSFTTFVTVVFVAVGAIGALWRMEKMSPNRPLRLADPGDIYVNSPLFADWRERVRAANAALDAKRRLWWPRSR